MRASLAIALVGLAAAVAAQPNRIIVDASGAPDADFTDLPPAVAAAQPGDVIDVLAGEEDIQDPEVRAALEKEFGLDKPIYVQYLVWLGNVMRGNFGKSMVTRP